MEGLPTVGYILGMIMIILAFAGATEATVEFVFGVLAKNWGVIAKFKWLSVFFALGVGVGIAFYYRFDLFSLLARAVGITDFKLGWPGILLTGALIGRGANFVHDFVVKFFKKPTLEES